MEYVLKISQFLLFNIKIKDNVMAIETGIFGNGTNFEDRYISNYKELDVFVGACKKLGLKIVLVSGSWDMLHIGHLKYLEVAKKEGDILIVGIDSDEKIRKRKGSNRPIVPESERMQMLAHCRHVDVIVIKKSDDSKLSLLRLVKPDTLIISETTKHKKTNLKEMERYCNSIVMLKPQAKTSTTAKLRKLHVDGASQFADKLSGQIIDMINKSLKEI
jgi:D-beta-D-heptose 7-phosphate kinase/D-beta-D-heptose 1-phosphate adenosyltransferase